MNTFYSNLMNKFIFKTLAIGCYFFSHSSVAASDFTFIEYNSAFILGLSLPLIIIAYLIKEKISNSWWYTIALGGSLLYLLYALSLKFTPTNEHILSAAALYVLLLSALPRTGLFKQDAQIKYVFSCNIGAIACFASFISLIWFVPKLPTTYLWLGYSAAIITITFIRLAIVHKQQAKDIFRFNFLWLLMSGFCIALFIHPYISFSANILVVIAVACYVVAFINYSWLLTSKIRHSLQQDVALRYDAQLDELKNLALDSVTNLPMQAHAIKRFEQYKQYMNDYKFAVIVFKPINFEKVNKTLGHHTSDILLLQFAYTLQQALIDHKNLINFSDDSAPIRLARLPSLQFLIILDITNKEGSLQEHVEALCRELSLSIPQAMSFKSFSLNFDLTYGVDYFDNQCDDLYQTIGFASDALLKAEQNNQHINFYNHLQNKFNEQTLVKMEQLKLAVAQNKITWLVQPQIHLDAKRIYGFELSAAWKVNEENKDEKPLLFNDFVDIAEMSGEIYQLTKSMISQACALAASNMEQGFSQAITIKFASEYMFDTTFIDYLEEQIIEHNLSCEKIIIALPETILLKVPEKATALVNSLRKAGISIAIDNFSGSQESLRYLRKLTIRQARIDCSQLANQEEKLSEKSILNALVNLTQVMHIPVIANHLNSASVEKVYQEIGGIYGQGNIICKYITCEQLTAWCEQWENHYP